MYRRFSICLLIVFVCFTMTPRTHIIAQGTSYMPNPPEIKIEIGGKEPVPSGISEQITFGGGGGGISISDFSDSPPNLFWQRKASYGAKLNENSSPLATTSIGCGYRSITPPRATLRTPSGKQMPVEVKAHSPSCYYATPVQYRLGMEFGIYTITFEHAEGVLSHSWGIDYPLCPTIHWMNSTDDRFWLMNFPVQNYVIYFFRRNNNGPHIFWASRNIRVGNDGDALLSFSASRSAGLPADAPFQSIRYFIVGSDRAIYGYGLKGFERELQAQLFKTQATSLPPEQCIDANTLSDPLTIGAIINKPSVQLLNDPGGLASATVRADESVAILGTNTTRLVANRVQVWVNVGTEDGRKGWLRSSDLRSFPLDFDETMPGQQFLIQPSGFTDSKTNVATRVETYFKLSPSDNAPNGALVTGKIGVLITQGESGWSFLETPSGERGWLRQVIQPASGELWRILKPLPWKRKDVSKFAPPVVPTKQPSSAFTCPNAPNSRLKIGDKARILPGDPNNLNSEPARPSQTPTSKKLADIPSKTVLTLLDGPRCKDDVVWWKVTYEGKTGWTGEGSGKVYWMEPVR